MKTTITLGDMADKGHDHAGGGVPEMRPPRAAEDRAVIGEHGRDENINLRAVIAHDCPRMQDPSVSIYELCGVMFPKLPRWFRR